MDRLVKDEFRNSASHLESEVTESNSISKKGGQK
jgi:hypothetical protein